MLKVDQLVGKDVKCTAHIAEVKRDLGLPMYDSPNVVEELKQPTAEKVEAIKDALKYF